MSIENDVPWFSSVKVPTEVVDDLRLDLTLLGVLIVLMKDSHGLPLNEEKLSKSSKFIYIPKITIDDRRLDAPLLGFLARLLRMPSDYNLNVEEFAKRFRIGLRKTEKYVDRFIGMGYIKREEIRDEENQLVGYNTHVYATPRKGV